jgi:hypothetical protein
MASQTHNRLLDAVCVWDISQHSEWAAKWKENHSYVQHNDSSFFFGVGGLWSSSLFFMEYNVPQAGSVSVFG